MKYKENEKQKLTFVLNYNLSLIIICADLFLIDIESFNSNYLLYIFIISQ